jgi:hypothetical protein
MVRVLLALACSISSAATQELPPLDPAVQLDICQQQRAVFLSDSEKMQTYVKQFLAEIADLKKKLAEAEEKLPKASQ